MLFQCDILLESWNDVMTKPDLTERGQFPRNSPKFELQTTTTAKIDRSLKNYQEEWLLVKMD